jgi:hypothetical protein
MNAMEQIEILRSATVPRSKMAENRVYNLADIVKSSFEEVVLECDQPENNAAGGQPDDGLVFHGISTTMRLLERFP